ncbi:MAG TPA: nicotinate phosphoribosyltransferase, partial [Thermomicrobiales bacterium]|nr:nicotinate phosphoribosyltransferase [Thermomicrobiales bacterium]
MRYSPDVVALSTDLYQLTMAASYDALDMDAEATFSLTVRGLPENRSFLVAAGIEEALKRIAELRFDERALEALAAILQIRREVLDRLARFRFSGDVWAMPEGSIAFADEPILEVQAPILEAQIVETMVLNAIHFPTTVATKAARCVLAAPGKPLVEFGLRRTPGIEAGLEVARACYLAGFVGTSNVLAEREYGIPASGTVAHSFIEAFDNESEAFRAFARTFPGGATLLIDTYDTVRGARRAAAVAREVAPEGVRIAAVRLGKGDLLALSREGRGILDGGRL